MPIAHRYTLPNHFYACSVSFGGVQPGNSSTDSLPPKPWARQWPQYAEGAGWALVEDHRERTISAGFDPEDEQEATEYWLAEDDYTSQPRTMKEPGPLPAEALLTPPEKPQSAIANELRAQRDAKINATQWLVDRHADEVAAGETTTLSAAIYADLLAYRQALRDLPQKAGFPWDGGGDATPWPQELEGIQCQKRL